VKRLIIAGMALASLCQPALAETYSYACHAKRPFVVRVDTTAKTLIARGMVFRDLKSNLDCAKAGWSATTKDAVATLCAATRGYADLTIASGTPGADGVEQVDCNQEGR
jgi:hypothetical protein